jgi:hypothetical protein
LAQGGKSCFAAVLIREDGKITPRRAERIEICLWN